MFFTVQLIISSTWAAEKDTHYEVTVTQVAVDPGDSDTLHVLTTYSIGYLKSTDGGENWQQQNNGLRNFSMYDLAVHPTDSSIIYIGAGGQGLMKSTDGGKNWVEKNYGLQNTDIGNVELDPLDPNIVYLVCSTGLHKSPDGGETWVSLNQGDNFTQSQQFQSLAILPTTPRTFFIASDKGLFTRKEGDAGWVSASPDLDELRISQITHDPRTGYLYAGVFSRGIVVETLDEGGLYLSKDNGRHWKKISKGIDRVWIRTILFDDKDPNVILLATRSHGILKSYDGGVTWVAKNAGNTDPDLSIRTLVRDPNNPDVLYAGSNGYWLAKSEDGGEHWRVLPLGPYQDTNQLRAMLNETDLQLREKSKQIVELPSVFLKCNKCHGWADPMLNRATGTWRVAANFRDWRITAKRMSGGANLTPAEVDEVAKFLNEYTAEKYKSVTSKIRLGRIIRISELAGIDEEDPVIDWDGERFLTAWQSPRVDPYDTNIYATRVAPEGQLSDAENIAISTAPGNQMFLDLAVGKKNSLIVWQDLRSNKRWQIYASRLSEKDEVLDPDGIFIAGEKYNATFPQVASDGENYFVVWMTESKDSNWDIAGVRISSKGKILDKSPIIISTAPGIQDQPVVAWGGKNYIVAWRDSEDNKHIYATRVSDKGKVLDLGGIVLAESKSDLGRPAVASIDGYFVVVWGDQAFSGRHTFQGALLDPGGRKPLVKFDISKGQDRYTFPAIDCHANKCLAVWEAAPPRTGKPMTSIKDIVRDVRGAWLNMQGDTVTVRDEVIAPAVVGNHFTKVSTNGEQYFVVWKDYETGVAASHGRMVKP